MKKCLLFFLATFYLIALPIFAFAQEKEIEIPQTSTDIKSFFSKFLELLPRVLRESWQEALEIWKKIYQKSKEIWNKFFWEKIKRVLIFFEREIQKRSSREIQKRSSILKEEFKKEIKELKEDILRYLKKIFHK